MIYIAAILTLCMSIVAFVAINECRYRAQRIGELCRQLLHQQQTLDRALQENLRLRIALAPFAAKAPSNHEPEDWAAARAALQPENLAPAMIEALSKLGR